MSRMSEQEIQDYIDQVNLYDADVIAGMIEDMTGSAQAGSVRRLNESITGPDVLEDITKLAILMTAHNTKIAENAFITDETLTQEGKAADAKATGIAVNSVYGNRLTSTWERGGVDWETGEDVAASTFIRSALIPYSQDLIVCPVPGGIQTRSRVYNYDSEGAYLGATEYYTPTREIIRVSDFAPAGTSQIRVSARRTDGAAIPTSDVDLVAGNIIIAKSATSLAGLVMSKADKANNIKEKFGEAGTVSGDTVIFSPGTYDITIDNPFCGAGLLTLTCKTTGSNSCSITPRIVNSEGANLYIQSAVTLKSDSVRKYDIRVSGRYPTFTKLLFHVTVQTGATLVIYDMSLTENQIRSHSTDGLLFSSVHGETRVCNSDTLPAFVAAAQLGYPNMIATPKRTSDGVWICYHDDFIDVNETFIRQADGSLLPNSYDNKRFYEIPYENVIETWDFGVSRNEIWTGTKALKLEDFFCLCAANGINPSLSMHPADTVTVANLTEIKAMTDKFNLTKSLTLKFPEGSDGFANSMTVFGNGIARYVINIALGSSAYATTIGNFIALANTHNVDTGKLVVEIFASDADAARAAYIIGQGLIASVAQNSYVHSSGSTSSDIPTGDIKKWYKMGYTEFTLNKAPYYGTNFM